MTTLNYQPQINLTAVEHPAKDKEKWRLGGLIVLAVLGAVALVFVYYRWFGNAQPESDSTLTKSEVTVEKPGVLHASSRRVAAKHRDNAGVDSAPESQLTLAPGVTQSAIRSPLAVEVISSDGHRQIVGTRNDSIYLPSPEETSASSAIIDMNAASGAAVADPVLAKQQTMEGAVVLLATIDKDGNIKALQPISGPEILYAAAREAIKKWRFKPYYASGTAVETETQITVKFAISAH